MCKVIIKKWNRLPPFIAAEMLKGVFPRCGIKYSAAHSGAGVVIAKYHASLGDILEKATVAGELYDRSFVYMIPKEVEIAAGI